MSPPCGEPESQHLSLGEEYWQAMDQPSVLLTNDDGIENDGLAVLYERLSRMADVTVVAPETDQSGVGRANSYTVGVEEHEWGYVVDGTPCDCVAVGHGWLDTDFDVVVAGCNPGPNIGAHKLDRSGTIGAAVEAVHLEMPGIAVSLYDPEIGVRPFERADFVEAASVTEHLLDSLLTEAGFRDADYLNVNVPVEPCATPPMQLTSPATDFDVSFKLTDEDELSVTDHFYDPLLPATDVEVSEEGTDRRACADGAISVSPLSISHSIVHGDELEWAVDRYEAAES